MSQSFTPRSNGHSNIEEVDSQPTRPHERVNRQRVNTSPIEKGNKTTPAGSNFKSGSVYSKINQGVLPKSFRDPKRCLACNSIVYKRNKDLCYRCYKANIGEPFKRSSVSRFRYDPLLVNGQACLVDKGEISVPTELFLDTKSYVDRGDGVFVSKVPGISIDECDVLDMQYDEKTFRRKAYMRRERKFKSKTIPKNCYDTLKLFQYEDQNISVDLRKASKLVDRYVILFQVPYRVAEREIIMYGSNMLFNKGFAGVNIATLERYLVGVFKSQKKKYFDQDVFRNDYTNKHRFLVKNFSVVASIFCVERFMVGLDVPGRDGSSRWNLFDMTTYILHKNNLVAQPQSFMDMYNNLSSWFKTDTLEDVVSWMTDVGRKVDEYIIQPAKDFLATIGFEMSTAAIVKGMLAVLIAGLLLAVMISLGIAFHYVYSIACTIASLAYDFVPNFDTEVVAEAQSFSQVAGTLLSLFGSAITQGSKFDLFKAIGPARSVGITYEGVVDLAIPFLDKICEYFTGIPNLLSGGSMSALQKLIGEMVDFVHEDDISRKVILSREYAERCRDLFRRSAESRKEILSYVRLNPAVLREFHDVCRKLEVLYNKCLSSGATDRQTPIFVLLAGEPGHGKSTIIEYLVSAVYVQLKSLYPDDPKFSGDFSSNQIFPRKAANKYWEGYAGQWACLYNELFPEKDPALRVETATELMAAVESSLYPLNMAGVELKGSSFFTSEIIIATTNVASFVDIGLYEPKAFLRRIHFPISVTRNANLAQDCSNIAECWKLSKTVTEDTAYMTGASQYLPRGCFGLAQLVDMIVSEYVYRRNSVKHFEEGQKIDWAKEIARGNPFQDVHVPAFVRCDPLSDQKCSVHSCYHRKNCHLTNGTMRHYRHQCFNCNPIAQAQMFGMYDYFLSDEESLIRNKFKDSGVVQDSHYCSKFHLEDSSNNPNPTLDGCEMRVMLANWAEQRGLTEEEASRNLWMHLYTVPQIRTQIDIRNKDNFSDITTFNDLILVLELANLKLFLDSVDYNYSVTTLLAGQEAIEIARHIGKQERWFQNFGTKLITWISELRMSMINMLMLPIPVMDKPLGFFEMIGLRVQQYKGPLIVAACVTSAMLVAVGVRFLIDKISKMMSHNLEVVDEEQDAPEISTETVIQAMAQSDVKSAHKFAKRRIGNRPFAMAQSSQDHIAQRMHKICDNIRYVELRSDLGKVVASNVWFGKADQFFIPKHVVDSIPWSRMIVYGIDGKEELAYNQKQLELKRLEDRDAVIVKIKTTSIPSGCKDLTNSLNERVQGIIQKPYRLTRSYDTIKQQYVNLMLQGKEARFVKGSMTAVTYDMIDPCRVDYKGYYQVTDGGGIPGACSSPWISLDSRHQNTPIFGMHVARVGADSLVCPLYKEDFGVGIDCQNALAQSFLSPGSSYFIEEVAAVVPGTSASEQAALKIHPPYESVFVRSPISQDLKVYDFKRPAVLSDEALGLALDKYAKFPVVTKPEILDEFEQHPDILFASFAPKNKYYNYQFLTPEQAVFGDSDLEIDAMDMSTSPGYPDVQKGKMKREHVVLSRSDKTLKPEFKLLVLRRIVSWSRGNFSPQVVVDTLKDELRENERVDAKKTRLFCVGNLVDFVALKMVTGHIISYLKSHRSGSSCAIGVNPHSHDWALLYQKIFHFGRLRVAGGDLETMDISTQRWMGDVMFSFFRYYIDEMTEQFEFVYRDLDCLSDEHFLKADEHLEDINYKLNLFNLFRAVCFNVVTTIHVCKFGTYKFLRGNSSGNYLTGFYNSLCTHVYLFLAFQVLCPGRIFEQDVALAVYGDDNLFSVSEDVQHLYNNQTIPAVLKKYFGVGMTDPNKREFTQPFLELKDQIFLSRRFQEVSLASGHHLSCSVIKAPLDKSSIFGCLHWLRKGGPVDLDTKMKQNLDVFMLEMYHYPRIEADIMIKLVESSLVKSGFKYKLKDFDYVEGLRLQNYNPDTFEFC